MTHELKIHPQYFRDVTLGLKKFEVRKNDRNYQERDILILNEFEPSTGRYTGNQEIRKVDYILKDVDGLTPEYAVLQISKLL
jgi:hypothetical protein